MFMECGQTVINLLVVLATLSRRSRDAQTAQDTNVFLRPMPTSTVRCVLRAANRRQDTYCTARGSCKWREVGSRLIGRCQRKGVRIYPNPQEQDSIHFTFNPDGTTTDDYSGLPRDRILTHDQLRALGDLLLHCHEQETHEKLRTT